MGSSIEDYALIGDLQTAALVGRDGSLDWLCLPRFDSPACFASLLGDDENGCWRIAPLGGVKHVSRRYREDSLVLETRFETDSGVVTLIDCMPVFLASEHSRRNVIRLVVCERGQVPMRMELVLRLDYGKTIPWVHRRPFGLTALSGPNTIDLRTPVPLRNEAFRTRADFTVSSGESVPFSLTWRPSASRPQTLPEAASIIEATTRWWQEWSSTCTYKGPWREAVIRSLITLKALSEVTTGGIIAAPTTSLPEWIGGERNWDYRYCWLRDATFTLYALLISGMKTEAVAWRDWLLRAAAGRPDQLQPIYGAGGERLLHEFELDWLGGYEGSRPVRVGNAAHHQLQLDVYGEILDVLHVSRRMGIPETKDSWGFQQALLDFLESGWRNVDSSIWEMRGRPRHFTHSKIMAWVGLDRAVKAAERFALPGPAGVWARTRDALHFEICSKGFDAEKNAFVQYYGAKAIDASLLLMPLVGFLPPTDPRVLGTIKAVERELLRDGFVQRYLPDESTEGLRGSEGAFLACTFWLADNYALTDRFEEGRALLERLLAVRNDVGLLAEQYDPVQRRQLGNFPQAFSHVALINTAQNLQPVGPALLRSRDS